MPVTTIRWTRLVAVCTVCSFLLAGCDNPGSQSSRSAQRTTTNTDAHTGRNNATKNGGNSATAVNSESGGGENRVANAANVLNDTNSTNNAANTADTANKTNTANTKSSSSSVPGTSLEWPFFGNNLWQDRFSPDEQITPDSVSQLKPAFDLTLPNSSSGNEAFPIEKSGTMYVTTAHAQVIALDASTGKIKWTFQPKLNVQSLPHMNRGVALWKDKVYVLSSDDQLIALNRQTGKVHFNVQVANPTTGVFESMAPLVAGGKVFVGSAGGDEGVRGFVAAFDAVTGEKLWQFDTVPKRGNDWLPKNGSHGGGAVWTTPTYDTETGSLYFGTGNPSPDYYGASRPGPNPYTDSVVKLSADHGSLAFAKPEVTHDLWDYDVASPPILFPLNGRQVVGEAGKNGEWYEWYTDTGAAVQKPVPFVKISHSPPTKSGVLEWPGPDGGANYGPSAYDPVTQQVFIAGINGPEKLYAESTLHSGHSVDLGTRQNPGSKDKWSGTITCINPVTGTVDWQVQTPTPPIGGVTVSEGGIVWYGQANGTLTGRSITDGSVVWQKQTGAPIGSAPVLYQVNGHTYLVIVTGGATSLSSLFPYSGPAHVLAYTLSK